ncbi:MOSC domain-containing protein [Nocardioides dongkuii]|uniref:MOSC domain-containing protein n=1 Tax=Nocardioides dongkuii TaxID=2760089 RepID=UPI0015F993EB|nr:MOSC N-terminal beta barrel domain-containing protein [Nocardioides dongkuii]
MRVVELLRFPVKSLRGEALERAAIDGRGVVGDRQWAVRDADGKLGSGKSTKRFRKMDGLLDLAAAYDGAAGTDGPVISFPDGRSWRAPDPALDAAMSDHVGRPVVVARESDVPHHDEGPLHLVTTATLAALGADGALLRANLVVDVPGLEAFAEDDWTGRRLTVGDGLVLAVREPMERCVMVGRTVLHEVTARNDRCAGLVVDVVEPGEVAVGDAVLPDAART